VRWGHVAEDCFTLDGKLVAPVPQGVVRLLREVRNLTGCAGAIEIQSRNDFPTAAGLASSASGMAALAAALSASLGLALRGEELSRLARLGSGSACRSVWGGFAEWLPGHRGDGRDSHAVQLAPPGYWPMRVLVVVVDDRQKVCSSSEGMARCQASSPFMGAFAAQVPADLTAARRALVERDWEALGRVTERSTLRLHAVMAAADPPLIYLQATSWAVMERAWVLRAAGTPLFCTADAGPNVKIFCAPEAAETVKADLGHHFPSLRVIEAEPGPGAEVVPDIEGPGSLKP